MVTDILLQVLGIGVTVFMFLYSHSIPQKIYAKLRQRALAADAEANRQFVRGAQLLSQARWSSVSATRSTLAKQAEEQADKAIAYDRRDAAAHILKGLALQILSKQPTPSAVCRSRCVSKSWWRILSDPEIIKKFIPSPPPYAARVMIAHSASYTVRSSDIWLRR
ncbi:unnamed protein product [Linum trigynum]